MFRNKIKSILQKLLKSIEEKENKEWLIRSSRVKTSNPFELPAMTLEDYRTYRVKTFLNINPFLNKVKHFFNKIYDSLNYSYLLIFNFKKLENSNVEFLFYKNIILEKTTTVKYNFWYSENIDSEKNKEIKSYNLLIYKSNKPTSQFYNNKLGELGVSELFLKHLQVSKNNISDRLFYYYNEPKYLTPGMPSWEKVKIISKVASTANLVFGPSSKIEDYVEYILENCKYYN